MKSRPTWVLIADGGHAKVFAASAGNAKLTAVADMTFSIDLPATRDMLSDRPGRAFESQGRARHAKENRSDPHRELKRAFAKKLGGILKAKLAENRFERLILVAPPPALGDLRAMLPKSVLGTVTAELAQDLVKLPQRALAQHLQDVLRPGR
jgi:protein required for attachment to host cells